MLRLLWRLLLLPFVIESTARSQKRLQRQRDTREAAGGRSLHAATLERPGDSALGHCSD